MMVDAIIRGELPPGLRLIETDLAKRFDVSRGPLREAMRRLDERGLIVRHARHGARVTELSVKVLMEISMVRELLESTACRLAAANMSKTEIEEFNTNLDAGAALVSKEEAHQHTEKHSEARR